MEFESNKQEEALIIKIKGRMDAITSPEFEKECSKWIDGGESLLVVDLEGLEYISSAGLRSILSAAKSLKAKQGEMRFCNLTGMVQEVFSISGFASMFSIFNSLEEALGRS